MVTKIKRDVFEDFMIDGRLKVGLHKKGKDMFFYETSVKLNGPNLRIFFERSDGSEYEMELYNVARFFRDLHQR